MSYGYYTDIYRLPTMVRGDSVSEREEKRKSRIIDNQLYISLWLHGTGNGVIKEGQYLGTFSSGNSSVKLIENKPSPALECLISQVYGYTTDQLTWTGLANNTTYYLYATIVENATDTNPSGDSTREYKDITTNFNTTGITPANSILIATATTTASAITITTNPSGKRYIKSIEDTTEFVSGITVFGNADFRQAVEIAGGITSGLNIYGNVVITGTGSTFAVWSPTTFNRPVTFNDYIIGNPLVVRSGEDVYGDETVRGNLVLQGKIASGIDVFGGDSIIRDDIVLQRTLDVLHGAYLEALTVRSGENIYGDSIFHDNVTIQDNLTVKNDSSLEYVLIHSGENVYGDATFREDVVIQKTLQTEGHTSASGLTIFGNLYITGDGAGGVTSHSLLTDMPSSSNTDHDGRYYKAGDSPELSGLSVFGDLHVTSGFPVGPDEKLKVTSNDTTPNYLTGKILAGTNITLTENNDGGNETLTIAATDTTNAPGGNDREVQFNNATAFGGAAGLRYTATGLVVINSGIDVYSTSTFRGNIGIGDAPASYPYLLGITGPKAYMYIYPTAGPDCGIEIDADPVEPSYIWSNFNQRELRLWVNADDRVVIQRANTTVRNPLVLHSGIDVYNAGLFRSGLEVQEKLGVGRTPTTQPLEVDTAIRIVRNNASPYIRSEETGATPRIWDFLGGGASFKIQDVTAGNVNPFYAEVGGSYVYGVYVDDAGQVSIGTGTAPASGFMLDVGGTIRANSGVDIYSTSTFRGNTTLQKDLKVEGISSQSGLTVFGDLHVTGGYPQTALDSSNFTGTNWVDLTDGGSTTLHTHAGGSGDITSVGDVASGAAFDGTQGTTLTFYNAGGNATVAYNGTNTVLSSGLDVYSTSTFRDDLTLQGDILPSSDSRFDFGTSTVRGRVGYFDRLNANDGTLADDTTRLINGKIDLSTTSLPTGVNLDVNYTGSTSDVSVLKLYGVYADVDTTTGGPATTAYGAYLTADSAVSPTSLNINIGILASASGGLTSYGGQFSGTTSDIFITNRTLKAGATYTFPAADGSAKNVWVTNGSGTLSWESKGLIYSGLDIYSTSTFRNDVTIQDDLTINRTLTVLDDSTLEFVKAGSGLDVYDTSRFRGDIEVQGDIRSGVNIFLDNANTVAPYINGQINYNSTNARFEAYGNGAVTTTVPVPVANGDIIRFHNLQEQQTSVPAATNPASVLGYLTAYNDQVAQSFQLSSTVTGIIKAQMSLSRSGSPGNITVRIETNNAGEPSGTLVDANATGTILAADVSGQAWEETTFAGIFTLNASTTYWLVLKLAVDPGTGNYYFIYGSLSNVYANGLYRYHPSGGSWTDGGNVVDAGFKIISNHVWHILGLGASGTIPRSDGTDIKYSTSTFPDTATGAGRILRASAANTWAESTSTFTDTYGASTLLYANGANTVQGLATANNGVLVTSGTGVPSISSTLPAGVTLNGAIFKGGRVTVGTINKAATASGTVTFTTAFSSTPNVSVDVEHSTVQTWSITVNTISTTAFSWQIYNGTGAQQTNVFMQWTANNGGDT